MNNRCQYWYYFIVVFGVFIFTGCKKVIHVNIATVSKKYVIEGTLSNKSNSYVVNISQTLNISETNSFIGVQNAIVTITEDNGTPKILTNTENGVYKAKAYGTPGHLYTLSVTINGEVFTATSLMPKAVLFDSLEVAERLFLGKNRKIAIVKFRDPPSLGNAYRFVQYVDGFKENTIFAINDKLINGRAVAYELFVFTDDKYTLDQYDSLVVEMYCIDQANYNFWYSLAQGALGQNQSASPGNPISNIKGNAIGYFSAQTFQSKEIIVP